VSFNAALGAVGLGARAAVLSGEGVIRGQEGLRVFGRFVVLINRSTHTGDIAIRTFWGQSYYVPRSSWLASWLFKRPW
jgi:hypothetical protein